MSDEFVPPVEFYKNVEAGEAIAIHTRYGRWGLTFDATNIAVAGKVLDVTTPTKANRDREVDPGRKFGEPFATLSVREMWQFREGEPHGIEMDYDTFKKRPIVFQHFDGEPVDHDTEGVIAWLNVSSEGDAQLIHPFPGRDSETRERKSIPIEHGLLVGYETGPIVDPVALLEKRMRQEEA